MDHLIGDLKSSHFNVGKESGARYPSNTCYGGFGQVSPEKIVQKGMGMGTHFVLGSDNHQSMSETKSRFNMPAGLGGNMADRNANKSKMQGDSVHIGGNNARFSQMTTSGTYFYNKDASNRHLNTNEQYKFMPNVNALKSHYP